ncbi:GH92 family glycosyl hydrolase [Bacteroides salyersiae]|uniref:GH92 family glycosyl hydrolase n=1 Tax=Bacteroides salyersiae TaxID=291644 RepID=UPI001CCF72AD|nr:GH92 family glycosyl hydrolase [Bacteroides salyersiae]UBD65929.1 GH92 family glycosyl hydrolase [Bacteroides salyersiae]
MKKFFSTFICFVFLFFLTSQVYSRRPVDYVNPLIDSHKSRWFYFQSACRPFGMVSLSPDTWVIGTWNSGYLYDSTEVRCFSHIHDWQLAGIPVMPVNGMMKGHLGFEENKSSFSHSTEVVKAGYHRLVLDRYGIIAELTSTNRVGFHRYTYPDSVNIAHILFDIGAYLAHGPMEKACFKVNDGRRISGWAVMAPTSRRKKSCTVYFNAQFNVPFTDTGGWKKQYLSDKEKVLLKGNTEVSGYECGGYVKLDVSKQKEILLKVAISYVSEEQAKLNMNEELPHWNFDQVVRESAEEWNKKLSIIEVEGGQEKEKEKFYTDLWHSLLGRHTFSDVDGKYIDNTGETSRIRQLPLDEKGNPVRNQYNSDAFWGAEWNLNILWSIAYPQVLNDFNATLIDYYHNAGMIARGPSGGNYTYVMVGDQAIPMIAAAYNKGIRNFDVMAALEGSLRNAEPGGIRDHAGYEDIANSYMKYYVELGYVPEGVFPIGNHRESAALTLYFAYEDWCLSQLAKSMGRGDIYEKYYKRSFNYRNLFDKSVGWMRPKMLNGEWYPDFSPVMKGFNAKGFVEGNSAIFTYYVPHNIPDLIQLLGGKEKFVKKLSEQFEKATPTRWITDHGKHAENWVDYENQPSLHMAHLFSHAGAPWLTQYWVRRIKEEVFGDTTPYGGYNGDEDQGQFGALGVLMGIGLFDVQGGASTEPVYEITAPLFKKISIKLDNRYYSGKKFEIIARNSSPDNIYIQSAKLNGKELNDDFRFLHRDLVKGGKLELILGSQPNKSWGIGNKSLMK